ncbi:hypothetical protein D3C80_1592300 [compost metagenome]
MKHPSYGFPCLDCGNSTVCISTDKSAGTQHDSTKITGHYNSYILEALVLNDFQNRLASSTARLSVIRLLLYLIPLAKHISRAIMSSIPVPFLDLFNKKHGILFSLNRLHMTDKSRFFDDYFLFSRFTHRFVAFQHMTSPL